MPRVPRLSDERIPDQPIRQARTVPGAPVETFGGNDPALREARGLARDLQQGALRARDQADQLAVLDFDNTTANRKLDIWREVRKSRGKDSLKATVDGLAQFDKESKDLLRSLNDRQRPVAEQRFRRQKFELRRKFENFASQEIQRYDTKTTNARLQTLRNEMADGYAEKGLTKRKMDEAIIVMQERADRNGVKRDVLKVDIENFKKDTHLGIIDQMISDGESEKAKEHLKKNRKDLGRRHEKLAKNMIAKFDGEIKRKIKHASIQAQSEHQRDLYNQVIDGTLSLNTLNELRNNDRITPSFYDKMVNRKNKQNDDQQIPLADKSARYFELLENYSELRGTETDDAGKILTTASGNDIETIMSFRDEVADNSSFLTKKQESDFYRATGADFRANRAAKLGLMAQFLEIMQGLQQDFSIVGGEAVSAAGEAGARRIVSKAVTPRVGISVIGAVSEVFGSIMGNDVSLEDAEKIIQIVKDREIKSRNPNKTAFPVGFTSISADGFSVIVDTHTTMGNPVWKTLD